MKKSILSFLGLSAILITGVTGQGQIASYKVIPEIINKKPVSPLIYGNFIELGFGKQPEGMWSEKLFNASFEEITPYKAAMWSYLRKDPDDDIRQRPWYHSAYQEDQ